MILPKNHKCKNIKTVEESNAGQPYWFFQRCYNCNKIIGQWMDYKKWMLVWNR